MCRDAGKRDRRYGKDSRVLLLFVVTREINEQIVHKSRLTLGCLLTNFREESMRVESYAFC